MGQKQGKTVTAYKGFDKNLRCRGFQYNVGKKYEKTGKIIPCENGFHACENPLDVLNYYDDVFKHRFCKVEQSGDIIKKNDKTASSKIKIKEEIGFVGLFRAGIEYIKDLTNPKKVIDDKKTVSNYLNDNGCDYAQIGSSGYGAQIGSSGYGAQIGSSGDGAKIESTGEDSVICCAGKNSVVKAKIGSWITLAEWVYSDKKKRYILKCVKTEYVDGKRIKGDTWYKLVDGEFKEV